MVPVFRNAGDRSTVKKYHAVSLLSANNRIVTCK